MVDAGPLPSRGEPSLAESRAQFVASLGRRLDALRQALGALEQSPASGQHRDHVRRRIHAFGAAAGVLGFDRVFEAFKEAEDMLGRRDSDAALGPRELGMVSRAVDLVPSLVLGGDMPRGAPRPRLPEADRRGGWPTHVLLFGGDALEGALREGGPESGALEWDRTEDIDRATVLVRLTAPEVAIVDADHVGARELVETLVHDPLLDPVRIVVVSTIEKPDAAAALVALGALRVLPKPVTGDALRRAVVEAARGRVAAAARMEPLGTATVEAVAERLGQELRRGLVGALVPQGRSEPIALGDGADVLAATWAAVARVRELLTARSDGAVRFEPSGPEGAVPMAPFSAEGARRATGAGERRPNADVTLSGRRILVADDDPSVVWFLSGLFRALGAEVFEAFDGRDALHLAFREWPELVVSDVLMPGLDGFSLCREIKKDLVLSDVPVILISWKEDLLQRVREFGADAEGYVKKDAAASTFADRVREVLLPRARVEARLAAPGESVGRLDGLTPRLVLEVSSRSKRNSTVVVRDAAFSYEVEVRDGRVRKASRRLPDGKTESGEKVLAALLGVRAGRFTVTESTEPCDKTWDEPLMECLGRPTARARAALRAFSGSVRPHRVQLDSASVAPYLAATPASVRALVTRLSEGASPDAIISSGTSARLVETILSDLVQHGAVSAIRGKNGEDLWAKATEELARELAAAPARKVTRPEPTPSGPPVHVPAADAPREAEFLGFSPDSLPPPPPPRKMTPVPFGDDAPRSSKSAAPPTSTAPEPSPFEEAIRSIPSEVLDAAAREPELTAPRGAPPKKLVLPRPRSPAQTPTQDLGAVVAKLATPAEPEAPAIPPPARLPALEPTTAPDLPLPPAAAEGTFTFALTPSSPPARAFGEAPRREAMELAMHAVTHAHDDETFDHDPLPLTARSAPPATAEPAAPVAPVAPSMKVPVPAAEPTGPGRVIAPAIVLTVAAASAYALITMLQGPAPSPTEGARPPEPTLETSQPVEPAPAAAPELTASAVPPQEPAPPGTAAPSAGASATPGSPVSPTEDLPLPQGILVGAGHGLLEVVLGGPDSIYVDDVLIGKGPLKRMPVRVGTHAVWMVTSHGKGAPITLEIREGRTTRLTPASVQ